MENVFKRTLRSTSIYVGIVLFITAITVVTVWACVSDHKDVKPHKNLVTVQQGSITVKVLPLGAVTNSFAQSIYNNLRNVYSNTVLLRTEKMPTFAYYRPRNRYRADSIIHWLSTRAKPGEVYIGITNLDISCTKDSYPDWGVMGLGYQPGNACVASDYRLKDKNNFFKVVIHELGHTAGLPHCPVATCFMRDAEGHDLTGEETEFCGKCKRVLQQRGWKL